jgi:prophage tail gpP-like protein
MGFIVKINDRFLNRRVRHFNEFTLNLVHDAIGSTFNFKFWFDPNNVEHVELTTPGHFHECTVQFDDELLLTGYILNHKFRQSSEPHMAEFEGYSLPGVLEDCEIPTSLYPLQSDGLSLTEIAAKLIKPFKLKMEIDDSVASKMNKSFKKSTASETSSVKDYLSSLASQKNIIISHNAAGNLLFTEAKTNAAPIISFDLRKPTPIGTTFDFEVNGQSMHKWITLQKQASKDGGNAGEQRVRNPLVAGNIFRETVKSQSSGDDNDTIDATKRALADELRAVKLTITTDQWKVNGKIVRPNSIIEIIAPKLFIFKKTRFYIESVTLNGDETKTTATWNCVMPEVYDNAIPKNIFGGINLHPIAAD